MSQPVGISVSDPNYYSANAGNFQNYLNFLKSSVGSNYTLTPQQQQLAQGFGISVPNNTIQSSSPMINGQPAGAQPDYSQPQNSEGPLPPWAQGAAPPAAAAQSNIPRDASSGPGQQPISLSSFAPNVQPVNYASTTPAAGSGGGLPPGFSGLPQWLQQLYNVPSLPGFAPGSSAPASPGGLQPITKGSSTATPQNTTTPGGAPTGAPTGTDPTTGAPTAPGLPGVPSWLQGLTNYGLPIAATLYGGLNLSNAYGTAAQQAAAAATGAGQEVNDTAQAAAAGIEGAAGTAATGLKNATDTAIAGVNPYATAGASAVQSLSQQAANGGFQFDPTQLASNPDYQFESQQGQLAAQRQLASQGLSGSGAATKAAEQYAQGLASTDLNNIYNRDLTTYQTNTQNLQNLAGAGQTASQYAGNTALTGAQGEGTFNYQGALEGGDFGLQGSSYQGNANTQAGLDKATGTIGSGIAQSVMANQIANILLQPQQPGQQSLSQILAQLYNKATGTGTNG